MATAPQKEALWIFPKALKLLSCLGERGLVASWYWPPGSWKDALWLVEEPEEECGGLQNLLMVELPTPRPQLTCPQLSYMVVGYVRTNTLLCIRKEAK